MDNVETRKFSFSCRELQTDSSVVHPLITILIELSQLRCIYFKACHNLQNVQVYFRQSKTNNFYSPPYYYYYYCYYSPPNICRSALNHLIFSLHRGESFIEHLIMAPFVKMFTVFVVSECSLPCSNQPLLNPFLGRPTYHSLIF
jgi:hypothetical protein